MFKKLLAFFAAMYMAVSFAAVDVNKATAAELDGIKGIGPAISGKIVDERKKGNFKDWSDFIGRVPGIGEGNAAKFSAEGLTVGGTGFKGAAAAPATAKKDDKPATAVAPAGKAEEKKAETKPAALPAAPTAPASAAKEVKKDAKAEAKAKADEEKAKKAADEKAKADEKKKKADEAKAKADAEKAAKAEAKKASETKPAAKDGAKADAASPAASAAKK